MMQWIDALAAPLLALLLLAAVGGFFVHERWRAAMPYVCSLPSLRNALRWWGAGTVAALAMVWLTWSVTLSAPATCMLCVEGVGLDAAVQTWVASQAHAPWMPAVEAVTQLGHLAWMAAMGVAASLWLLYRRAWLLASAWLLSVAGVGLWVRIIKNLVARERPEVRWVLEQGFSFPSGHSAGTLVCYGMLAWLVIVLTQPTRKGWWVAQAALVIFSVGASRVLLGAHYVSDVLAGWLLGWAWMCLVLGTADAARYVVGLRQRRSSQA